MRHDRKEDEDGLGRKKLMYRRKGRKKKMGREYEDGSKGRWS